MGGAICSGWVQSTVGEVSRQWVRGWGAHGSGPSPHLPSLGKEGCENRYLAALQLSPCRWARIPAARRVRRRPALQIMPTQATAAGQGLLERAARGRALFRGRQSGALPQGSGRQGSCRDDLTWRSKGYSWCMPRRKNSHIYRCPFSTRKNVRKWAIVPPYGQILRGRLILG